MTSGRAHAGTGDAVAISASLGTSDRFHGAIADFTETYADVTRATTRPGSRRSKGRVSTPAV